MNKRLCIISGANRGIGKAIATEMAYRQFSVIMVCRNTNEAEKTRMEIINETGNQDIYLIHADFSSIKQVLNAAEKINNTFGKAEVLFNNCGVFHSSYTLSENGLENTFAVNYFSAFAFTNALLPSLEKSDDTRVINLSSNMHRLAKDPIPKYNKDKYNGIFAYANSKLAILLFTRFFGTVYPHICCNAFHPGPVKTDIGSRNARGLTSLGWKIFSRFFLSPAESASTGVKLACDESLKGISGKYFYRNKVSIPSAKARNIILAEKLWDESSKLLEKIKKEHSIKIIK